MDCPIRLMWLFTMEKTLNTLQHIFEGFDVKLRKIHDHQFQVYKNNTRLFTIKIICGTCVQGIQGIQFFITRNNINYFRNNNILNFVSVYNACKLFLDMDLRVYEQAGNVNNDITNDIK